MSVVDNSSFDGYGDDVLPIPAPFDFGLSAAKGNLDAAQCYSLASGPAVMFVVV